MSIKKTTKKSLLRKESSENTRLEGHLRNNRSISLLSLSNNLLSATFLALDFPLIFSSISLIQSFLNIFEKHSNANSKTTTKVAKSVSLNLQRLLNLADALNILPWCLQTCRSIEETAQNKIQFLFFFVNYIRTKVIGIIQKHRKVAEVRYTRLAVEMSPTTNSLFRGLFKQKVSRFVLGIFFMSHVTFSLFSFLGRSKTK